MSSGVERIETASPLRRSVEVWYAVFGGIGAWMAHLVFLAAAEHWAFLHPHLSWTLQAATGACALATVVAIVLAGRLYRVASGNDPASSGDGGQLLFLAQLGLLVGAINLALILLEGSYVLFIPRG